MLFIKRIIRPSLLKRIQELYLNNPIEFEKCINDCSEWEKTSFKGNVRLDKLGVTRLSYKGNQFESHSLKKLIKQIESKISENTISSNNNDKLLDKLKLSIQNNPAGIEIILLQRPREWGKVGIGGLIHIAPFFELEYKGNKSIGQAVTELIAELQIIKTTAELEEEKTYQFKVRPLLSEIGPDSAINIGSKQQPMLVNLVYDWGYYVDAVHVEVVEGYSTPLFKGGKSGCLSWREMYLCLKNNNESQQ